MYQINLKRNDVCVSFNVESDTNLSSFEHSRMFLSALDDFRYSTGLNRTVFWYNAMSSTHNLENYAFIMGTENPDVSDFDMIAVPSGIMNGN